MLLFSQIIAATTWKMLAHCTPSVGGQLWQIERSGAFVSCFAPSKLFFGGFRSRDLRLPFQWNGRRASVKQLIFFISSLYFTPNLVIICWYLFRRKCISGMADRAFNVYNEFYTHTTHICFFLNHEAWQAEVDNTIKLYVYM